MKVALLNDTSDYHCGCKAVISVLEKQIAECGGEIVSRLLSKDTYGNVTINPQRYKDVDIIIINGEGSMHHGNGGNILKSVVPWIGKKKIYLVNSVWDGQPESYGNIVAKFDRVFAREIISADNMIDCGIPAKKVSVFPDLCIQADATYDTEDKSFLGTKADYENRIGATNSYLNWGDWVQNRYRIINIKEYKWNTFVKSISTAKAMYTGLHHGMYACIKARTPFVVYKHNCCKIEGVLKYFDCMPYINVINDAKHLDVAMETVFHNTDAFEDLFDKVEAHPKFELKDYL